jgi:hypothetical protein
VFARDLWRIEIMEGFVDRGGEGRFGTAGLLADLKPIFVGAIEGDCRGELIGLPVLSNSEKMGGSRGVVACIDSSCCCGMSRNECESDP